MDIQNRMKCYYTTPNMKPPKNDHSYSLLHNFFLSDLDEINSFRELITKLNFLSIKPTKVGHFAKVFFGATPYNKKFYISFSPYENNGGHGKSVRIRSINSFIQEFIEIIITKPIIRVPQTKREGLSLSYITNDHISNHIGVITHNHNGKLFKITYNHFYTDLKKILTPIMQEFNQFISGSTLIDRIRNNDYEKSIKFFKESAAFAFSSGATKEEMIEIINLAMINEVHHE